jgi:hypothetical protein
LVGATLGANITHQAAHGVVRIAKALGHFRLRLLVNEDGAPGFIAAMQRLLRFEEDAMAEGVLHHKHSEW